jgi:hypothetical protein
MEYTYEKVINELKLYSLNYPTLEQYNNNKLYYDKRAKNISRQTYNKLMKKYGICEFTNGSFKIPSWIII